MGKAKAKAKKLEISTYAGEYYEHSQWAKTEKFLEEYKKRAAIESKNNELKRFHGLERADGYGLKSVRTQAKLTAIAVNLKRIAKLLSLPKPATLAIVSEKVPLVPDTPVGLLEVTVIYIDFFSHLRKTVFF
jgi:hypothetical protein